MEWERDRVYVYCCIIDVSKKDNNTVSRPNMLCQPSYKFFSNEGGVYYIFTWLRDCLKKNGEIRFSVGIFKFLLKKFFGRFLSLQNGVKLN